MKKKILILIPTLEGGGAEKILINLFNLIDKEEYEINLYLARKVGPLLQQVPSFVKVKTIFPNKILEKISILTYVRFGQTFLMKKFGQKIKGGYDVGISFLNSVYSDFLFFNQADIKKRVTVIHSSYISFATKDNYSRGAHVNRMKLRYSKMDSIIAVSHESMKEFQSLFGIYKDMRVIYNPINSKTIQLKALLDENVNFDTNSINVIAVGRLIPVKGYEKLVRACKLLLDKELKFRLTILGDGVLKEDLLKLIDVLDLNDIIRIIGYTSNPYAWLKKADIYVMTSESEGLPTALCEAMVLGKAVLVTNVSGCREIVDYGKYGLMVEGNVENIADGLENLILDSRLRKNFEEKAVERAALFDDSLAIQKYHEVFEL